MDNNTPNKNIENEKLDTNASDEDITKNKKLVKSLNLLSKRINLVTFAVIFGALFSFITTLTSFMVDVPIWCDYSPFSDREWCNPLPCSSKGIETVKCADTLFRDNNKYHNPANLRIETLLQQDEDKDEVLTTSFRIDNTMLIRVSSERDGYIFVFNIEPDGKIINYFPNQHCYDIQQGYIKAGKILTIPGNLSEWPCYFPVKGPIGIGTLVVVLIEKKLEYNVLPLVFNKHIEKQHAKSLLYLLSQQLETLTIEDEDGEFVPINWSVKMADYHVIR